MEEFFRQQTLLKPASCSGIGVHSGKKTTITLHPAPENHGIRFRRIDLAGTSDIQALFKNVVDTSLATVVGNQGVIVSTVEHLMAAFSGLGIDNALVEIDAYEVPIMDGSSAELTTLITETGIQKQNAPRWFFVVTEPITYEEDDKFVTISPGTGFKIECSINFAHPLIGKQSLCFNPLVDNFKEELSRARTFGFMQDIEYLKKFSLGRGGSLETAIILDKKSIINEEGLRYPDEFVRHKLLDCLGDFSLLGMPILGHIKTHKSGHALNHAFIKKFLSKKESWETRPVATEPAGIG